MPPKGRPPKRAAAEKKAAVADGNVVTKADPPTAPKAKAKASAPSGGCAWWQAILVVAAVVGAGWAASSVADSAERDGCATIDGPPVLRRLATIHRPSGVDAVVLQHTSAATFAASAREWASFPGVGVVVLPAAVPSVEALRQLLAAGPPQARCHVWAIPSTAQWDASAVNVLKELIENGSILRTRPHRDGKAIVVVRTDGDRASLALPDRVKHMIRPL